MDLEYFDIKQSAQWAADYTGSDITTSNISYLLQYGRLRKYGKNGKVLVKKDELKSYYDSLSNQERLWKEKLGDQLNWRLSFAEYKEKERTKHVHRLHPYKGKFIPQLVEYFLDSHTDEFKTQVYFQKGDVILDPFCGSGTTLVQASELGLHGIGLDISSFNCLITNVKIKRHDLDLLLATINKLNVKFARFCSGRNNQRFEKRLLSELSKYNSVHFPSSEYRRKVNNQEIDEKEYAQQKENDFLPLYYRLLDEFQIDIRQRSNQSFLDQWYIAPVREEIDFLKQELQNPDYEPVRDIISVILSRVARSCRATTHADLGTLKEPVTTTYYCKKHGKICKPVFSISGWWNRYSADTVKRVQEYEELRTDSFQHCLHGDSRITDVFKEVGKVNSKFAKNLSECKIKGIFSSPPYVGLIDYHDQHAYAYEIFNFKRDDELEIGPLYKGQGKLARDTYKAEIAKVLVNCKQFLQKDYEIFLVANDKFNLYPEIAQLSNTQIVNQFRRPVLNRVEKDRSTAYEETIFHFKER